jgi:hypothetical protein
MPLAGHSHWLIEREFVEKVEIKQKDTTVKLNGQTVQGFTCKCGCQIPTIFVAEDEKYTHSCTCGRMWLAWKDHYILKSGHKNAGDIAEQKDTSVKYKVGDTYWYEGKKKVQITTWEYAKEHPNKYAKEILVNHPNIEEEVESIPYIEVDTGVCSWCYEDSLKNKQKTPIVKEKKPGFINKPFTIAVKNVRKHEFIEEHKIMKSIYDAEEDHIIEVGMKVRRLCNTCNVDHCEKAGFFGETDIVRSIFYNEACDDKICAGFDAIVNCPVEFLSIVKEKTMAQKKRDFIEELSSIPWEHPSKYAPPSKRHY